MAGSKNAQIQQGSSVAVYGAGPVGLLTIACARLLGAEQIFVVDHHPYRLHFAADRYGAIPLILMKTAIRHSQLLNKRQVTGAWMQ